MDQALTTFLEHNRGAAMITVRRNGAAHAVRVGIALVDGKIWSSGTQSRLRTRHLRRDPRSTLFVFDAAYGYASLECTVNILDGADAPELNLRLFEVFQRGMTPPVPEGKVMWSGAQRDIDDFLRIMREERRLIYEFEVQRASGLYGDMPS
ncbi:MAG TPA: pyridoxamine 5'-phosphate oxidase family protein [Dehalococcoidia bacterium]|nr:pyridoxamine 5'-phosphate oxidase family protein [Dehalococcoidia bacterium]